MTDQNFLEYLKDQMDLGKMTADEANVQMVLSERVRVIDGIVPREVRKALNAAVKEKRLGHRKKEWGIPEMYFNPSFEYLAKSKASECFDAYTAALRSVLA